MAQGKRRTSKGKTKRTKASSGRRPKRKAPATRRKKATKGRAARPAVRPDRNAARVVELEAENRRLRDELDRLRAEQAARPAPAEPPDLPPDEY